MTDLREQRGNANRWQGVRYETVEDFNAGDRPGWVKLNEDTPAYRLGARWYVRCMSGVVMGRLGENHTVTEHEDGTITVEPSLVMHNGWHGWLRHGEFEMLEAGSPV
jgi:hypothetical protein